MQRSLWTTSSTRNSEGSWQDPRTPSKCSPYARPPGSRKMKRHCLVLASAAHILKLERRRAVWKFLRVLTRVPTQRRVTPKRPKTWSLIHTHMHSGFSQWLSGQESACNADVAGDAGLIRGSGRSPGGGHNNPLQRSCPESFMDRGAWWAIQFMGSQRVGHN